MSIVSGPSGRLHIKSYQRRFAGFCFLNNENYILQKVPFAKSASNTFDVSEKTMLDYLFKSENKYGTIQTIYVTPNRSIDTSFIYTCEWLISIILPNIL